MFFNILYTSVLFLFYSIFYALSQPNLCENPKIDSIVYLGIYKMYFFTSSGYYWLIKEKQMPPPIDKAKPLPYGFKIGESATFKDTLFACIPDKTSGPVLHEQEIYLTEKTSNGQKIMIFNIRSFSWRKAFDYKKDRIISEAPVDWSHKIDSMFDFNISEIYVIQGSNYAAINFTTICNNPKNYSMAHSLQNVIDFQIFSPIDAMTMRGDRDLYIFIETQYYVFKVDLKRSGNGRIYGIKSGAKSIKKDFFKYNDDCSPPLLQTKHFETTPSAKPYESSTKAIPYKVSNSVNNLVIERDNSSDNVKGEKDRNAWNFVIIILMIFIVISLAYLGSLLISKSVIKISSRRETTQTNDIVIGYTVPAAIIHI